MVHFSHCAKNSSGFTETPTNQGRLREEGKIETREEKESDTMFLSGAKKTGDERRLPQRIDLPRLRQGDRGKWNLMPRLPMSSDKEYLKISLTGDGRILFLF